MPRKKATMERPSIAMTSKVTVCPGNCKKRCHHGDPVAITPGEEITCETCRACLGLPQETPFEHVCPNCRATKQFSIKRDLRFRLDGPIPMITVRGDDTAECLSCNWIGQVKDLQPHSERTILCSFSVSMNYDVPIKVQVPLACETDEQLTALVNDGEIDWLEEINSQYSTVAIERHTKLEHHELLSVEFTKVETDSNIE